MSRPVVDRGKNFERRDIVGRQYVYFIRRHRNKGLERRHGNEKTVFPIQRNPAEFIVLYPVFENEVFLGGLVDPPNKYTSRQGKYSASSKRQFSNWNIN